MRSVGRQLLIFYGLYFLHASPAQAWDDVSDFFTCDFFFDPQDYFSVARVSEVAATDFVADPGPANVPQTSITGLADFGSPFDFDVVDGFGPGEFVAANELLEVSVESSWVDHVAHWIAHYFWRSEIRREMYEERARGG